jgi:hypothetical protein
MIRFERRQAGDWTEFWAMGADPVLAGALERLWWRRGDGGWVKRLRSPDPAQAARAFANLPRVFEAMLRQLVETDPVPWEDALAGVCQRFESSRVDWWLSGSAALAVRGAPLTPHDLDLIVAGGDAVMVGDLLIDGLIEPVCRGEWELSEWWGRAFVHARVEWAGGITAACDEPDVTDFGFAAERALQAVRWRDWDIKVPPLHLQRAVNVRRGLTGRVAMIDQLLG